MVNLVDLLSIGDASLDVFMTPTESESLCQLNEKECLICLNYGDKIPVKNLEFCVGGNAANNAVGVTRLGLKSALLLTLGDDSVADNIISRLNSEKVELGYVVRQRDSASNYSTIINYGGERTIFTYHVPRNYQFPAGLPVVPWVYLTSMGENFRPYYDQTVSWLKQNPSIKLAFNPGSWQLKSGREGIADILSLTHLVFVNREEAEKLTNFANSQGQEKDLLTALSALGPKICVITDGNNGSIAFDGTGFFKCGVLPVDAYERTGAGDAFGSGCLSAIIKGRPLAEALLWGTLNSASVIGYVGSQRGLLHDSEMPVWLERAKSSGVLTSIIKPL